MEVAALAVFWVSITGIFYPYVIFTLILFVVSRLKSTDVEKRPVTPRVSLIIAAYNEENVIAQKLENALALDYPPEQLEIIVACDGCDDGTGEIVERYRTHGVKYLAFPRRGKVFALTDAVAASSGEILVFSDANTMFDVNALRMLARNFADDDVGGVCGNQLHTKGDNSDISAQGEKMYWSYDKWLKLLESRTGSIVSADGAIYAIRKRLFKAPESAAVTDDFAISTAVIEQGYRLVYEPEALASEPPAANAGKEFGRKVRIINRGIRGVLLRRKLLNPVRYGFYSLVLFSHKLSRRLVPFFLITLLAANLFLVDTHMFYQTTLMLQLLFYGLAFVSFVLKDTAFGRKKLFYAPLFFCLANLAAFIAILNLLAGRRIALWQPQR